MEDQNPEENLEERLRELTKSFGKGDLTREEFEQTVNSLESQIKLISKNKNAATKKGLLKHALYLAETTISALLYYKIVEKYPHIVDPSTGGPLALSPLVYGYLTSLTMSISNAAMGHHYRGGLSEEAGCSLLMGLASVVGAAVGYFVGEEVGFVAGAAIATYLSRISRDKIIG